MINTNDPIPEHIKNNSRLRDVFLKYQELTSRGKLKLRRNRLSENQIDFDLHQQLYFFRPKDELFFQHPEKQQEYYNALLKQLSGEFKPPKLEKYKIDLPCQHPINLPLKMRGSFKKRIAQLEIRKIRMFRKADTSDQYFKARIGLIDLETTALLGRTTRLKPFECTKPSYQLQNHNVSKEQMLFSQISNEDIQIYLKWKLISQSLKRTPTKLRIRLKAMPYLDWKSILAKSAEILSTNALAGIKKNQQIFDFFYKTIDSKIQLKTQIGKELSIQFIEYLKPLKFVQIEDGQTRSLAKRYDRIPLVINSNDEAYERFKETCSLYLASVQPNIPKQKLIYQMTNLIHMQEGFQRYLSNWECHEQNEYSGVGGLQKLIIELGAFDDAQELKELLKTPLPIYPNVTLVYVQNDWVHLLDTKLLLGDEYQMYMKDKFNFVTIDVQTQKLINLLPIALVKQMNSHIDSEIQMLKSNKNHLFNVIENFDYIERTRESLRLSQINELFTTIQKKQISYRHRTKFKGEFAKVLEEVLSENLPHESTLQAHFGVQVSKMRDYHRKLLYIENAFQSIKRQLTFDLLYLRKCKTTNIIDTEFLIRKQENKDPSPSKPNKQRKAIISFQSAEEHRKERFISELSNEMKFTFSDIIYNNEDLPDVFVKLKNQYVMFDVSKDQFAKTIDRIIRTISFFVNKFEKLTIVTDMTPMVDRFQCAVDCLGFEAQFQFSKLQLVQDYFEIYQSVCDPLKSYQLLEWIFQAIDEIPLIDPQSFYFEDSYKLSIRALEVKRLTLKSMLEVSDAQERDYISLLHQQYHLSKSKPGPQFQEESQQPNETQTQIIDEFYDYLNLSNKMTQIFSELNKSAKESQPSPNVTTHQANSTQKILDFNAELFPHYLYDCHPNLNFYWSRFYTFKAFCSIAESLQEINTYHPTKSITGYLASQIAIYEEAKSLLTEKLSVCKELEENQFFQNPFTIWQDTQQRVIELDIQANLNFAELSQIEAIQQQGRFDITDKQLATNLANYIKIKETFLLQNFETKLCHQIFKKQRGISKLIKSSELYNRSSITQNQSIYKKAGCSVPFSAYFYEIDPGLEAHFCKMNQPEILAFTDVIEEFRNIIWYDHVNLQDLKVYIQQCQWQLSETMKKELDLIIYGQTQFFPENTLITEKDLVLVDFNEKLLLQNVKKQREAAQQVLLTMKNKKTMLQRLVEKKVMERSLNLHNQSEKAQVIIMKKFNNFKLFLIRHLIFDYLYQVEEEGFKLLLMKKTRCLTKFFKVLPSFKGLYLNNKSHISQLQDNPLCVPTYDQIAKLEIDSSIKLISSVDSNVHIESFYVQDQGPPHRVTELLKYYFYLEQACNIAVISSTVQLTWWESMHLSELILFDLSFENYDLSKELLYQGQDQVNPNPMNSLFKYDIQFFEPQLCDSYLKIEQKTIMIQSLDKLIELVKSYHSIRTAFKPLHELADLLRKSRVFADFKKIIKHYSSETFKKSFLAYHQSLFLLAKDYPLTDYPTIYYRLSQFTFQEKCYNAINLNHHPTKFIMDGTIDSFNQTRKNKYTNQLYQLIHTIPLSRSYRDWNLVKISSLAGQVNGIEKVFVIKTHDSVDNKQVSEQLSRSLKTDAVLQLKCMQQYPYSSVQIRYFLQQHNIINDDIVYEALINISVKAMEENIVLLSALYDQEPQYLDRLMLQNKLASKANTVLPRVKYIPSFFNTLSGQQQSGRQIPTEIKVSFIQGFLNRLKNKAVQVDLMSSGVGYVISSTDLEDCINMLNKELFTFSERELCMRMETFNLMYEAQKQQIALQEKQLKDLKAENAQLKESFEQRLSALTIAKSNQILFSMEMLKQKYHDFLKYTNGIEERIRLEIDSNYHFKLEELEFERDTIQAKFNEFKQEVITLCKQEVKMNQESLLSFISGRTQEIMSEMSNPRQKHQGQQKAAQIEKRDQEVLFEPYQYTKAMHKIKQEYNLSLEAQKQSYEKQLLEYKQAYMELSDLKLALQESQRKENTLKLEIINLQQTISQLIQRKDELMEQNEQLQFERKRLHKICEDQQQKLRSFQDRVRVIDIKRRNAMSVDMNQTQSQTNTEMLQRSVLPRLYRSENRPKLKI